MDFTPVDQIARAILYEGYLLYPYRTTSLKNCRPCAFGSLYPRAYSEANGDIEPWSMQIECLVCGDETAVMQGAVRFLQVRGRDVFEREVIVLEFALGALAERPRRFAFSFAEEELSPLAGTVELSGERMASSVFKVRVRIENDTPIGGADHAMLSTHAVLGVRGGRFLSLIDPPEDFRALAESCKNRGAWPVLAGDPALANRLLAAPIILYDFPQIAPESPGNLFDGTEIDELLTLRILTLADPEKQAMRCNEHTRILLERTESLANDQMSALHGTIRPPPAARSQGPGVSSHALVPASRLLPPDSWSIKPGNRVIIRPQERADVLDLALDGKSATIVSIEQDFEGTVFYTVALDDDPGRDLGIEGKPGHRFFFRRDELEFTGARDLTQPRILIAGVGNIFHGDDAFGSEVARRLAGTALPAEARVVDFGIRGHDLAFALPDGYRAVILLDVARRGGRPGTLSVIELDFDGLSDEGDVGIDTHAMHPLRVLCLLHAQGMKLPPIWLVACEPLTFGPEEGHLGLSEPVAAAVCEAVALVHSLLERMVLS